MIKRIYANRSREWKKREKEIEEKGKIIQVGKLEGRNLNKSVSKKRD